MNARKPDSRWTGVVRRALAPLLMLAVLTVLVGGLWFWVQQQSSDIVHLEIQGRLRYVAPGDVQVVVRPYLHAGFFDIDIRAMHAAVQELPWVERAQIQRRWPNGVVVRIHERQPVARWDDKSLLTLRGEVFTPAHGTLPEGLPVLSGPANTERVLLESLLHFNDVIAPAGLKVASIGIDPRGAWNVTLDIGLAMRLGRTQIEERLRRFADTAVPTLGDRLEQVAYVDLRYGNGFAVRWRDTTPPPAAEEG